MKRRGDMFVDKTEHIMNDVRHEYGEDKKWHCFSSNYRHIYICSNSRIYTHTRSNNNSLCMWVALRFVCIIVGM